MTDLGLNDGAIERMFPGKPKHPGQKYRLTEKTFEWKEAQLSDKQQS